jgi:hypothetical protein
MLGGYQPERLGGEPMDAIRSSPQAEAFCLWIREKPRIGGLVRGGRAGGWVCGLPDAPAAYLPPNRKNVQDH